MKLKEIRFCIPFNVKVKSCDGIASFRLIIYIIALVFLDL